MSRAVLVWPEDYDRRLTRHGLVYSVVFFYGPSPNGRPGQGVPKLVRAWTRWGARRVAATFDGARDLRCEVQR